MKQHRRLFSASAKIWVSRPKGTAFMLAGLLGLAAMAGAVAEPFSRTQNAAAQMPRAQVLGALQGYEWQPEQLAPSDWPEDVWQVLLEVADDTAVPGFLQARAAAALVNYPNSRVWAFYQARLAQTEPVVDRRRALDQLCVAFAQQRAMAVTAQVAPLLLAQDAHLRIRAALCLAGVPTAEAASALATYQSGSLPGWEREAAGLTQADSR